MVFAGFESDRLMKEFTVFIDGASKGNPGPSGIGVIIQDKEGEVVHQIGQYIGNFTNNQAEYKALVCAIEELRKLEASRALIYTDSELLARQWNGLYKVKEPKILELFSEAKKLAGSLHYTVEHISRDKNFLADKIANESVNSKESKKLKKAKPFFTNFEVKIKSESREEVQISAGGVVYKKAGSQVKICLIAKKGKSIWALPKGRVRPGEDPEVTAKREIKEETGCLAEVEEKIDEIEYFFHFKETDTFYHKYVFFYLMPVKAENVSPRDTEACDVRWFTLGDAYSKLTYLDEKEVVRKVRSIFKT